MFAARLATRPSMVSRYIRPTCNVVRVSCAPHYLLQVTRILSLSPVFRRNLSNSSESEDQDPQEILKKLQENPGVRAVLAEFQELIKSKGIDPAVPPSITEMMKLFAQKDVRDLAGKVKEEFDKAGIVVSPTMVGQLMEKFKS